MATIDKKYLDQAGLQHLIDEKAILKHPDAKAAEAAAVKVGTDANGHVVIGAALTPADIKAVHTDDLGDGKLTIKVNGKAVTPTGGDFSANTKNNSVFDITVEDLGLSGAMHFRGTVEAIPATEGYIAGDVILVGNKEYVLLNDEGTKSWKELGDESSHALKSQKIEAGAGLVITAGGTLAGDTTIAHAQDATKAKDAAAVKVGSDAFGHVVLGEAFGVAEGGAHGHTVSATIPAETFVDDVTHTDTHLALDKKTAEVLTAVPGTFDKLERDSIIGVAATTVTASKATAGTAVAVATVGDAVVYGTADVGSKATVAVKAADATTVGNANRAITGTQVGNADVGDEFTAGSADVDTAVTYGTADCDTAKTVATLTDSAAKIGNANVAAAPSTFVTGFSGTAYQADYIAADECLELTALTINTDTVLGAVASSTTIGSAIGTTSVIPAKASTKTLTPAKAATKKLNAAKALSASSKEIYEAVESTKTIFGVGDTVEVTSAVAADTNRKIVPAVANGTITPYTFTDVEAAVKAGEKTFATGALSQTADGATIMTGIGNITTATVLLNTTAIKTGETGDVTVVSDVAFNKNDDAKTISGTAADNGAHNHNIV